MNGFLEKLSLRIVYIGFLSAYVGRCIGDFPTWKAHRSKYQVSVKFSKVSQEDIPGRDDSAAGDSDSDA